ncbi:MAG TPA: lysylphosphatidylglycerol synthase transmembrane domain-containing protein [Bacteroidales bacterium]|nr:lysylphosphatidylglycerol synthase transmembrane domain-containing protein [Bacteroidales bacterium]
MLNKRIRDWLILIIKVVLSLLAIVYVLKRIKLGDIKTILASAHDVYLVFAFLLFVASKMVAAFRTLLILNEYSVTISWWDNLKLYWTGMFYNLFLPGGIGGDVYKTVVINKMHSNGIKISAGAVLTDRIAGVAALVILALLCILLTDLHDNYGWISYVGIPITLIGFICIILFFMPRLKSIIGKLLGWSFLVQIFQVLAVLIILVTFNINTGFPEYLLIFLISSIAAMLPLSVGGIGIRELVFFSISDYLGLDQNVAVTVSFTFYLITAIASLWGAITALERRRLKKSGV